ncbi:hypothetical protein HEP24_016670, partial [Escherichia coli]|nr:hypothetical protein [Escherichia coli]
MKFKKCLLPVAMLASFTLAGCQSNADDHAADVYQTDQLNTWICPYISRHLLSLNPLQA